MFVGDRKELIMLLRRPGMPVKYSLVCFGRKRHYRKDGSCKHTAALLVDMKPWHRARTTLTPWGRTEPTG